MSDKIVTMKAKIFFYVLVLAILSACSANPKIEAFTGKTVATLQTPVSIENKIFVTESAPGLNDSESDLLPEELAATKIALSEGDFAISDDNLDSRDENNLSNQTMPNTTPTITPTLGIPVWEGKWMVWFQNSNGAYSRGTMELTSSSEGIRGEVILDDFSIKLSGGLVDSGRQAKGEWEGGNDRGEFWWRLNYEGFFTGSRNTRFGFCGSQVHDTRPDPCREVVP